ncbi:hypothetical protein I6J18_12440 [Peribacillus psychrosaccharolyticus]|uniref:Uncharacterized protein n=2 Tax=Peribacillus psychrosaccharolyticus TaxID=1407 RepID=A0A974NIR9_PERPY|nr:hypothetical protein [Peribacillus psychrosaccharolyticus]MED3744766.1 hypothetical protein [Peribacillus psychrosaccharolyticus]QQS98564.1 hypothetical protein I6J18_12440 [Peribacillus psychrosaccharolyticus]
MIRMHNLPENIKNALKPYYKEGEKPDVFPAKFSFKGELYYYFTFAPAEEQLILRNDGSAPFFEEIKEGALLANNFNTCIEKFVHIGAPWAVANRKGNYENYQDILNKIERKLGPFPEDVQKAYHVVKQVPGIIIENQRQILEAVKKADELWLIRSQEELVTDQDEALMESYFVEMIQAQVRQNDIQIKTEKERKKISEFVSSKKGFLNLTAIILSLRLKPFEKNMFSSNHEHADEWGEFSKLVLTGNRKAEEVKDHYKVFNKLRNPKS